MTVTSLATKPSAHSLDAACAMRSVRLVLESLRCHEGLERASGPDGARLLAIAIATNSPCAPVLAAAGALFTVDVTDYYDTGHRSPGMPWWQCYSRLPASITDVCTEAVMTRTRVETLLRHRAWSIKRALTGVPFGVCGLIQVFVGPVDFKDVFVHASLPSSFIRVNRRPLPPTVVPLSPRLPAPMWD